MKACFLLLFCVSAHAASDSAYLPDRHRTPGAIMASCTLRDAQTPNYTKTVRNVPASLAKAVYASYGLTNRTGKCSGAEHCEVDHLISLVLCGDNTADNLWPQSYSGPCNAHDKDVLEVRLHHLVQSNSLSLAEAQSAIRTNWIVAYRHFVGPLTCKGTP